MNRRNKFWKEVQLNKQCYCLPVPRHSAIWRFTLLTTAIGRRKELRACKTTANSSPSVISGVIVVSQCRIVFPRDSTLRNNNISLDTLVTGLAYVSFTAKYAKAVKFIRKHADLPSSVTGGKYMSMLRSLSKSTDDFCIVSDKAELKNSTVTLLALQNIHYRQKNATVRQEKNE